MQVNDGTETISAVMEILDYYSEHGLCLKNTSIKLPEEQVGVKLPKEIADKLNLVVMRIGEQFRLYRLRAKINFRSLLKRLAHRNGRKLVTEAEDNGLGVFAYEALKINRLVHLTMY